MNKDLKTDFEQRLEDEKSMEAFWAKEHESGRKIAEKHGSPAKHAEKVSSFKNLSKEERAERFYFLLDENIKLKTHQAVLDGELVKTSTRLQRIKEMIARERKLNGSNFGIGFDKHIDQIIDENTELSLDNKKLRSIIRGLKDRMAEMIKSGYFRPGLKSTGKSLVSAGAPYKGGRRKTPKRTTKGYKPGSSVGTRTGGSRPGDDYDIHTIKDKDLAIQKMREVMNTQDTTIQTLQNQIAKSRGREVELKNQLHEIRDQLDDKEKKFDQIKVDVMEGQKKDTKVRDEITRLKADNQALKAQVLTLQSTQGTADENRKYIHEITMERNNLQSKLTSLLTDPFFRREEGDQFAKKMRSLEEENKSLKEELSKFREERDKRDEELKKLREEYDSMTGDMRHAKVHGTGYPFKMTGGAVDLNEMKKALMSMDPSVFRATMDQLTYDGDEPLWAKIDFLEQLGVDVGVDTSDPKSVARRMELMKQDKKELAAALEKAQQLLKLQYDIEKDNKAYYQAEVNELNTKIKELTLRLEESRKLADQRLEEITVMKKTGYAVKGEHPAIEYDRMDVDSEFSYATLETDLKHEENILDLALDKAEYYTNSLLQVVESDVVSEKGFLTFFTVEFFDHDVKATDVNKGLEPAYSTLFSFKNKVDDYYIEFLQTNRIKLELFLNKSQKAKKIGFANVALRELIERDYDTMEGMKSPIITGLININSSANPSLRIGMIKYKMRMRKSLNEALRWFREKHDLNTAMRSKKVTQQYLNTKIIAIQIVRCTDLHSKNAKHPDKIQPFIYYNFYKFDEYYSKSSSGPNPEFNDIKTYSTEIDEKFKNYTEEKTFEIHVLDDSVHNVDANTIDVDETIDDMIGVAHVPLFDLAKGNNLWDTFTVKDYNGNVNGMIEVKITLHDTLEDVNAPFLRRAEFTSDDWTKEFLFKICFRYVDKEHVSLTNLFAIFSKGEENISRQNFKDTIIPKRCGVTESEIEMFIKDCEPFRRRGYMNRDEFTALMRGPYKRAVHEERIRRKELQQRRDSEDDEEDFKRATKQTFKETKKDADKDTNRRPAIPMDNRKKYSVTPPPRIVEEEKSTYDFSRIDVVKGKIKEFMVKDGISLSLFYEYIDKDGDKRLDLNEFQTKIKNIGIDMTPHEIETLFRY